MAAIIAMADSRTSDAAGNVARNRAAAERARREAEARRKAALLAAAPAERGGPPGPEPIRYGDWEVKGIASDF